MRLRIELLASLAAALLLCATGGTASAAPIPFPDPDDEFDSSNGLLRFSDFQFYSPCGSVDPSEVTLEILSDGVEIAGPLTVEGFGHASFYVSYRVSAIDPDKPINGASLSLVDASVEGHLFPLVSSKKHVFDDAWDGFDGEGWGHHGGGEALAFLKTAVWGSPGCCLGHWEWLCDGGEVLFDTASFAPQDTIQVVDGIRLLSWIPGNGATFSSSINSFSVVPEPGSFALLAIGLSGLALAGGRPQARRSRSSK